MPDPITKTYELISVKGVKGWVRDSWARRAIVALQTVVAGIVVPTASTSNPVMDGTAAPGSSTDYAREDHVHPHDTSKADAATTYTKAEVDNLIPSVPTASTANPAMNGTASPGTSTAWARGDHVHPSDTSKIDVGKFAVVTGTFATTATWSSYCAFPSGFTDSNCAMLSFEVYRTSTADWRMGEGMHSNSFSRSFCSMDSNGVRATTTNSGLYGADFRVVLMRTDI